MHNQLVVVFPIQYFSANHKKIYHSHSYAHCSCSDLEGVRFDDHYLSYAQSRMRIRVLSKIDVFIMQGCVAIETCDVKVSINNIHGADSRSLEDS